jgi:hypothetical protein
MQGFAASVLVLVALASPANAQPANSPLGQVVNQAAAQVERVYTPLDLKKCRHRPGRGVEDYGSWRCAGHDGIAVHITAGDQRSYISYGPNAANEVAAQQTLSAFNSEGKTIEWRIERLPNGKPHAFATVLRWNVTALDPDDDLKQIAGQVLVVTRLGPGGVCHVGYVDGRANPNANELAAELADKNARAFKCGKDKPITLGVQGKGFSRLYGG